MKLKQKILFLSILIVEVVSMSQWLRCVAFKAHFSSLDLQLRLIESIHTDSGVSIFETRLFHNKILYGLLDTFNLYLNYLNIAFLADFISLTGLVGLVLGVYYWLGNKTKSWYTWVFFLLLLVSPLLEIFDLIKLGVGIKLIILWFPFVLCSLYGYYHFLQKPSKTKYAIIIGLLILSIWYIVVGGQSFSNFCSL